MSQEDVIIGISTPYAKGAISIIRLSGEGSIQIVNKVFKGKDLNNVNSHTINYGHICGNNGELLDEVLVSVFKAPKTYTKEDVVEINCHGGIFITNLIFENLVNLGARPAEPGEFTKRAFLNGRIDLTKAEAVMDIIDAENKTAIKLANQGINGNIYNMIRDYRQELLDIIAVIDVNIDYPEYDDVEILTNEKIKPQLYQLQEKLDKLLNDSIGAKYLKEGINTAIIGKPNVGKSTILNAILKENKAIVTNIPGTTRDIVEGKVNLGNITLNLTDTAGIRKTKNIVEQIGVEKSKQQIDTADLILLVLDGSTKLSLAEKELMETVKDKPHLVIMNKKDILLSSEINPEYIYISAHDSKDIEQLEEKIIKKVLKDIDVTANSTYLGNSRQISKLRQTLTSLQEAMQAIENDAYIDFVEIYLREAYNYLGEITGDTSSTSLLDELFSKFCLGK